MARYGDIAFTDNVKAQQARMGSQAAYDRFLAAQDPGPARLSARERDFIAARDSFYLATVNSEGWPYIQHRGGPPGFLKTLDANTLGFADFSGNRQYVSTGNIAGDNRVSLFLMDYANRKRLKIFAHAKIRESDAASAIRSQLDPQAARAKIERYFILSVIAFDWNCPQWITPRFTAEEAGVVSVEATAEFEKLRAENKSLVKRLAALESAASG